MANKLPELDEFGKELLENLRYMNEEELINFRLHLNAIIANRKERRILASKLGLYKKPN